MRRGALLLEVMLALALFAMTALLLLAIMGRSLDALEEARDRQAAGDLARSAMSRIEAGLASPESLNGPVQPMEDAINAPGDDAPVESEWELVVETEPSVFDTLTLVTITAQRIGTPVDDLSQPRASGTYTLSQLVNLRAFSSALATGGAP